MVIAFCDSKLLDSIDGTVVCDAVYLDCQAEFRNENINLTGQRKKASDVPLEYKSWEVGEDFSSEVIFRLARMVFTKIRANRASNRAKRFRIPPNLLLHLHELFSAPKARY